MTISEILSPHPETESVCVRDFFRASRADIEIERNACVFVPDEWTKNFASGLEALSPQLANSAIVEVGVGSGIIMAGLLSSDAPPASYKGIDICDDALFSSRRLAERHGWNVSIQRSDLLQDIPAHELYSLSHIIACIPQVPAMVDLNAGDNSSHYYPPTGSEWDKFGLGLNAELLKQAKLLAPHAEVTLNLSGRPGLPRLTQLFTQHGYASRIVEETMVPQHNATSLQSLAEMEKEGYSPFEFFADKHGDIRITARQAEHARLAHQTVFHKLYAMSSVPVSR